MGERFKGKSHGGTPKRNLDRNPFWQPGFLGPDRYEPKDWSAVDASNEAWLNQEGYK